MSKQKLLTKKDVESAIAVCKAEGLKHALSVLQPVYKRLTERYKVIQEHKIANKLNKQNNKDIKRED